MKRALFALLFSTAVAFGGDSLEQQLTKRSLVLVRPSADRTLSEALAALSTDYQTHYHEPLPIYLAVGLAQPPNPKPPQAPPPKIPGLEPILGSGAAPIDSPAIDPASARIDGGPLRAPVIELLRYITSLAGVTFAIRDDCILIHAEPKPK